MRSLAALASEAARQRVPLAMLLKSELGIEILARTAGVAGLVLQGGGAVHHVYGSPRFSADLDFAQQAHFDPAALEGALSTAAHAASEAWGRCSVEGPVDKGRLHRHKLRLELDPGSTVVLAIERYEVPAHEIEARPIRGEELRLLVESPAEIVADKLAAACDRVRTRGATKLRDVFDISFLLGLGRPARELVLAKLADYGYPRDLSPLLIVASSLDEVAAERLRAELRDVLPREDAERFDAHAAVLRVRELLLEIAS